MPRAKRYLLDGPISHLTRCVGVVILLISVFCGWPATAGAEPILKDGDRVVFLGDSITGELYYSRMLEDFFTLRYPAARIQFYNVGYGGDTATARLPRLASDVLGLKPTVVTICYGMNDGGYAPLDPAHREAFQKGMSGLVTELKKAGVKVVLLTPGCVDPDHDQYQRLKKDNWTYNETLAVLAQDVVDLAARENVPVFHLYPFMLEVQTKAKEDDPKFTMIPDGIHPTPAGHAVMAYALLKVFGCAEQASGLEIDAGNGQTVADRCRIEGLRITEATITFTRTDAALPAGFYPDVTPILKYLPLIEEFNQYRFKVTGLKAPAWKLVVEGLDVGRFSNAELAAGLNLAPRPGPWQSLAKRVDDVVVKEQAEFFQRWIYLSHYPAPDTLKPELAGLIAQVDAYVDQWEDKRLHAADVRTWNWTLTAVEPKP